MAVDPRATLGVGASVDVLALNEARVAHRGNHDTGARLTIARCLVVDAVGTHQLACAHASNGWHAWLDVVDVVVCRASHVVQRERATLIGVQVGRSDHLAHQLGIGVGGPRGRGGPIPKRHGCKGGHWKSNSAAFHLRGRGWQRVDDTLKLRRLADGRGARDGHRLRAAALNGRNVERRRHRRRRRGRWRQGRRRRGRRRRAVVGRDRGPVVVNGLDDRRAKSVIHARNHAGGVGVRRVARVRVERNVATGGRGLQPPARVRRLRRGGEGAKVREGEAIPSIVARANRAASNAARTRASFVEWLAASLESTRAWTLIVSVLTARPAVAVAQRHRGIRPAQGEAHRVGTATVESVASSTVLRWCEQAFGEAQLQRIVIIGAVHISSRHAVDVTSLESRTTQVVRVA